METAIRGDAPREQPFEVLRAAISEYYLADLSHLYSSPGVVAAPSVGNRADSPFSDRLDPGPGVDLSAIEKRVTGIGPEAPINDTVCHILATPQYQLA
jgi:hypothetical protein